MHSLRPKPGNSFEDKAQLVAPPQGLRTLLRNAALPSPTPDPYAAPSTPEYDTSFPFADTYANAPLGAFTRLRPYSAIQVALVRSCNHLSLPLNLAQAL